MLLDDDTTLDPLAVDAADIVGRIGSSDTAKNHAVSPSPLEYVTCSRVASPSTPIGSASWKC